MASGWVILILLSKIDQCTKTANGERFSNPTAISVPLTVELQRR